MREEGRTKLVGGESVCFRLPQWEKERTTWRRKKNWKSRVFNLEFENKGSMVRL